MSYTKSFEKHELRGMKLNSDRTRMYGYPISINFDKCMAALCADSDISDCLNKKYVKILYEIILKTHALIVGGTGEKIQSQANNKYATIVQRHSQITLEFERRLQGTVAVGMTTLPFCTRLVDNFWLACLISRDPALSLRPYDSCRRRQLHRRVNVSTQK